VNPRRSSRVYRPMDTRTTSEPPVRIAGERAGEAPERDNGFDELEVLRDADVPVANVTPEGRESHGDDREAFAAFYRSDYPNVARALSYTLGDVDLGREATDEAMARAYAHWTKIRDYDSPAGWVYRVGLNWAYSTRRRLMRTLALVDRVHHEPPVSDPAIADALRKLDVKLRAVVVCRLLLDWSVDETADALRIKPGTVKSRLHRALASLERSLGHMRS